MRDVSLQQFEAPLSTVAFQNLAEVTATVANAVSSDLTRASKVQLLQTLIKHTMESIEKTPVKGRDQLILALRVMINVVRVFPESETKTFLVNALSNGAAEAAIELIVQASKGDIDINTVVEVATGCTESCKKWLPSCCGGSTK